MIFITSVWMRRRDALRFAVNETEMWPFSYLNPRGNCHEFSRSPFLHNEPWNALYHVQWKLVPFFSSLPFEAIKWRLNACLSHCADILVRRIQNHSAVGCKSHWKNKKMPSNCLWVKKRCSKPRYNPDDITRGLEAEATSASIPHCALIPSIKPLNLFRWLRWLHCSALLPLITKRRWAMMPCYAQDSLPDDPPPPHTHTQIIPASHMSKPGLFFFFFF